MCIRIPVLLLFLWSSIVQAQELVLRHIDEERGLPSNCVLDLFVDSEGLLWVATNNGLYRYDGFTYERMGVGTGLDEVNVVRMKEFPEHDLFVFSGYGMRLFTMQGGTVNEVKLPEDATLRKDGGHMEGFVMDAEGRIHFGFTESVGRGVLDTDLRSVKVLKDHRGNASIRVDERDGQVTSWMAMAPGNGMRSDSISVDGYRIALPTPRLSKMFRYGSARSPSGRVYFTHNERITILDRPEAPRTLVLPDMVLGVTEDDRGRMWVRVWKHGLLVFDRDLKHLGIGSDELRDTHVTACVQDGQGGIWFGTIDQGLYYCASPEVVCFPSRSKLKGAKPTCLQAVDREEVIAGTGDARIVQLNRNGTCIIHTPEEVAGMEVKGIVRLAPDEVYVGRFNEHWDPMRRRLVAHRQRNPKWETMYDLLPLGGERYLLATIHGLLHADLAHPRALLRSLHSARCTKLLRDPRDQAILVATNKGLFRLSSDGTRAVPPKVPLLQRRIQDMAWHGDSLWLATIQGPVLVYGDRVWSAHLTSCFAPTNIRSLVVQDDRWMWLATMNGLFRMDLRDPGGTCMRYGRAQGLPSDAMVDVAVEQGRVWVISGADICTFLPEAVDGTVQRMPLSVLSVVGNDTLVHDPRRPFSHHVDRVTVLVRDLDLRRSLRTPYRFRSSSGAEWSMSTGPEMDLVGLSPGTYTLEIQAADANGQWGPSVFATWSIAPPFWSTFWFRALLILLLVVLVIMATTYLRNRRHREQLLAAEVQHYHHKALLAQMEPHFLYNALNSIQGFVADHDVGSSTRYLARFAKLMRGLLNAAHNDHITLREEMDTLSHYCALEALRTTPPFSFRITADADIVPEQLLIPSFLVQPYAENAIRHGLRNLCGERSGELTIHFAWKGYGYLCCTVCDNGVGRERARRVTAQGEGWRSLGTRINAERVPLLSRMGSPVSIDTHDLHDVDGQACGTKVVVQTRVRMLASRSNRELTRSDEVKS